MFWNDLNIVEHGTNSWDFASSEGATVFVNNVASEAYWKSFE